MAFFIGAYEPGLAAATARMRERSIRELAPAVYTPQQVAAWAARATDIAGLDARLSDGRQAWLALNVGDVPVGLIDLEADGHIDFLYVAPEAAGQGVARKLVQTAQTAARAAGITRLHTEASEIARGFFERMGFAVLHRRELELDGVPINNWKMEKILKTQE